MTPTVKMVVLGPETGPAIARYVERINTKVLADKVGCSDSTAKNLKRGVGCGRATVERLAAVFGPDFVDYLTAAFAPPSAATLEAKLHTALVLLDDIYRELPRHARDADAAFAAPAASGTAGGAAAPAGVAGGHGGAVAVPVGGAVAGADPFAAVRAAPRRAGWLGRARRGMTGLAVVLAVVSGLLSGGFDSDPLRRARTAGTGARAIARAAAAYRGREQLA